MKKGNIVDLRAYRKRRSTVRPEEHSPVCVSKDSPSKELQIAIKKLIQRMRKQGPMKRARRA